jgi:hypothetical protein
MINERLIALDQAFLLGIHRRLSAIGQVQLAEDVAHVPYEMATLRRIKASVSWFTISDLILFLAFFFQS